MFGLKVETKTPPELPRLETITITPQLATDLLERNGLNRPLSDQHVKRIANQIRNGHWRFNGDTIKVANTGDVLDGQHRLWAIIEAKKAVDSIIVHGIEREAFATIDTLRKPRSGGDVLALNGASRYRAAQAAAIQWLIRWQRGVLPDYRAPQNRIENSDIEEWYAKHPAIINAVERSMPLRGMVTPSLFAFLYYVITNRQPFLAERMMVTIENPGRIGVNDPYFRLRSFFLEQRRKDPLHVIALTIKATNAAHKNQEVKLLKWANQGKSAEDFPVLKI